MSSTVCPLVVYGLKVKMADMVKINSNMLRCGHRLVDNPKYQFCPHCGKKAEPYRQWVAGYINDNDNSISLRCGTHPDIYEIDGNTELFGVLGYILNKPDTKTVNPSPVAEVDETTAWHVADFCANNGIEYVAENVGVFVIQYYN